jgi:hypothetical protein
MRRATGTPLLVTKNPGVRVSTHRNVSPVGFVADAFRLPWFWGFAAQSFSFAILKAQEGAILQQRTETSHQQQVVVSRSIGSGTKKVQW